MLCKLNGLNFVHKAHALRYLRESSFGERLKRSQPDSIRKSPYWMQGLPTRVNLTPVKFNLLSSSSLHCRHFFFSLPLSHPMLPLPSSEIIFDIYQDTRVQQKRSITLDLNYDVVNAELATYNDDCPILLK